VLNARRPRKISSRSARDNRNGDRIDSRLSAFITVLIARATAFLERGISFLIARKETPSTISSAIRSCSRSDQRSTTPPPPDLINPINAPDGMIP
jgi:hypothetical protein